MKQPKVALPGSPVRTSVRLRGYDYSGGGVYFVTVCAFERACLFGEVVDSEVRLNGIGAIVSDCWRAIAEHQIEVEVDAFVVMPNHIHGILRVAAVGATHASPAPRPSDDVRPSTTVTARGLRPRSLGSIVGSFKSAAGRLVNEYRSAPGASVWQRNYHEHVIRNDAALERIRQYIQSNPALWREDPMNPSRMTVSTNALEPWFV